MATGQDVLHLAVGDIDLAYTTMGEKGDPPVLLVAGLGAQLISWDDGFCAELVGRGLFVIRYDSRDVGLSTHLGDPAWSAAPGESPIETAPPPAYALADLAADAAGLIDNLGLGLAHVVGSIPSAMSSAPSQAPVCRSTSSTNTPPTTHRPAFPVHLTEQPRRSCQLCTRYEPICPDNGRLVNSPAADRPGLGGHVSSGTAATMTM